MIDVRKMTFHRIHCHDSAIRAKAGYENYQVIVRNLKTLESNFE